MNTLHDFSIPHMQIAEPQPCPTHGEVLSAGSECSACMDDLREAQRQYAADLRIWHAWQGAGIPARLQAKTIESWKARTTADRQALATLTDYRNNLRANVGAGRGVVLMGGPGLGKSHLLAALLADAVLSGMDAGFLHWPDFIARHREAQQDRAHKDRDLMQHAMDAGLLAIDEIGLAPATEWQLAELFRLIDSRYRNLRPILMAGNITPATLAKTIGDRAADRLAECCITLPLTGSSRRTEVSQQVEAPRIAAPEPQTVQVWTGWRWSARNVHPERLIHGRREL